MTPDIKNPGGIVLWILGALALACLFRIGWEMGGVLWSAF